MAISETTSQSTQAARQQTAQPAPRAESLTSDFDSFIKMLTAQARFQDPLKPIDSTEYASQLAQFSMVEQQVRTNDTLSELFGQLGTANMASLAGWVGMEARAVAPAHFDGNSIMVSPNPSLVADAAYLVVTDMSGKEIQRKAIPISNDPVEWQGLSASGKIIPHGEYNFTVESFQNSELIGTEPAGVYGRINEAQIHGGEVILIMQGGTAIPASSVTALRSPA